jgi:hypothetical protein
MRLKHKIAIIVGAGQKTRIVNDRKNRAAQ